MEYCATCSLPTGFYDDGARRIEGELYCELCLRNTHWCLYCDKLILSGEVKIDDDFLHAECVDPWTEEMTAQQAYVDGIVREVLQHMEGAI
jgi:hypothetical protein